MPPLAADTLVERLRALAAEQCNLKPDQIHLLHKAKMLRDGQSLAAAGLSSGDLLRVARRQAPAVAGAAAAAAPAAAVDDAFGAPMPMAWGGSRLPPGVEDQARIVARAMGVPLEEILGGLPLEQVLATAAAAQRRPGQPPARETGEEMQARFIREARDMAQRVLAYLRSEHGGDDAMDGDADLLADIAGTLAECRSRGAPVPNAAVFVDRAVARRREMLTRQARLDREASGLDPELEDALRAAEVTAAAAEHMPRRLGHGPAGTAPGPGGPRGPSA